MIRQKFSIKVCPACNMDILHEEVWAANGDWFSVCTNCGHKTKKVKKMVEYGNEKIGKKEKVKNLFLKAKDLTKKYAIKSKELALKLIEKSKDLTIKGYEKVKPYALKAYENSKIFAKDVYDKIKYAIKQRKQHGRPLIIELPLYIIVEGFKGLYKGAKEGKILYDIRRSMKDLDVE